MKYSRFQKKVFFLACFVVLFFGFLNGSNLPAEETEPLKIVSNILELKSAVRTLTAGDKILIKPGVYNGGFAVRNVQGTKLKPIIISGIDPEDPPIFSGKGEAVKLSSVGFIKLANLSFISFTGNGVNIDDGGNIEKSSHHIIIDHITIKDIGPKGNNDAIKMSGVNDFIVRNSSIQGWGGSGIDMVGCHNGIVQTCQFQGLPGYRTKNSIQIKGGSSQILVQDSIFINSGERIVNIGGSTGLAYFRPQNVDYEAKNVIIAGNRFVGGEAQIAWVTSQNSDVHHNIFYLPDKFVGRILQETKNKQFKPSQKGLFEANLVVTDGRIRTFFNVGRNTLPESFTFARNAWYRIDSQEQPKLPTHEIEGIYGIYPDLEDFGTARMRIVSQRPELKDVGPRAYSSFYVKDFEDIKIPLLKEIAPGVSRGIPMQWILIGAFILVGSLIMGGRFVKKKR